ncbi:hypothetical protein [Kineococcus indalonis]|uniref:hypothetical protein n=1 Tax=Kineococcus indalonis TaxID=2696566 RepID=UPI0014126381|nr:hypothetical protein [Kineococcus indalonis]NAZ85992.1 hypothetical protein [Kineococcus indalonis]
MAQRRNPRPRQAPPPVAVPDPAVPDPAVPDPAVQGPTSTGAIAATIAAGLALLVSTAYFPLSIVMAAVVLVLSVRALVRRAPHRGWWTAANVLGGIALASSVLGAVLVLGAR